MSGWMEWTILPGEESMDHPEHLREITVRVPVGVDVLLGSRIMQGASDLMSLLAEAWGVEATPMLRARTVAGDGDGERRGGPDTARRACPLAGEPALAKS